MEKKKFLSIFFKISENFQSLHLSIKAVLPHKFPSILKIFSITFPEFNDLHIVGKFGFMTIPTFTKIREPIANSTITQLHISDDDEIYLVTECGLVYKSNDFRNIMDLRFDEMKFPGNDEKIVRVAPGSNFVSVMTESGRCFSKIADDSNMVESGKLKCSTKSA